LLLLSWWIVGSYAPFAGVVLVVLSLIYFRQNDSNEEILIGFMYILLLSDRFIFAGDVKDIYMILFSLFLFMSGGRMQLTNKFYLRYIPFFIFALFCLLFSLSFSSAFQKTISYILLFITVPNYVENIYRESGRDFLKNIAYYITITLVIGLLLIFFSPAMVHLEGRYRGVFFINPNGLGLYCMLAFLLFYVLVESYPDMFERREKIIIFAIILLSLYLTRSRNSLVAAIIFFLFRYFYKISPFLGFVIFVIILVLYQLVLEDFPLMLAYLGLEEYFRIDTLSTGSGRVIAWNFAWKHIEENFFVGRGISYTEVLYKLNYNYLANLGHQGNAHNSYLTLWLDTGLIGLVLYLFGFISVFIKAASQTRLAMPIMYAVLFSIFFESWLTASLNPLTIVFLVLVTIIGSESIEKTDTVDDPVDEISEDVVIAEN